MLKRRNDDELISAYLDGQLDEAARKSFDTRLSLEPALRQRVDVTRQLVQSARQTAPLPVPRNFTLTDKTVTGSQSQAGRSVSPTGWRLGMAIATAVFVLAVGLDISAVARPPLAFHSLPAEVPAPSLQAAETGTVEQSTTNLPATAQPETLAATPPTPQASGARLVAPAPEAPASESPAATNAESVTTDTNPSAAASAPNLKAAAVITETQTTPLATVAAPSAGAAPAPDAAQDAAHRPIPTAASAAGETRPTQPAQAISRNPLATAPVAEPEPVVTPLRAIAVAALAIALICGFLGWRPRGHTRGAD